MKQAGFHAARMRIGYLGSSLVLADWRVRLFGTYDIIDRPSDRLYVRIIPCLGAWTDTPITLTVFDGI